MDFSIFISSLYGFVYILAKIQEDIYSIDEKCTIYNASNVDCTNMFHVDNDNSYIRSYVLRAFVFEVIKKNINKSFSPCSNGVEYSEVMWTRLIPFTTGYDCNGSFKNKTDNYEYIGTVSFNKIEGGRQTIGATGLVECELSLMLVGKYKVIRGIEECSTSNYPSLLGRLPTYTFAVLPDVLAISLLFMLPPNRSGVPWICLILIAVASLITVVMAVTSGLRLESLIRLSVAAIVILRQSLRKRHVPVIEQHRVIEEEHCVSCDADDKESTIMNTDCDLEAVEARLCSEIVGVIECRSGQKIRCWSLGLTETLNIIGARMEAAQSTNACKTGTEVPEGRVGRSKHEKAALGGSDSGYHSRYRSGLRRADTHVSMIHPGWFQDDFSVEALVARGLSAPEWEPQLPCDFCSLIERGLRDTARDSLTAFDDKIYDEYMRDYDACSIFYTMAEDLSKASWNDPPIAVVDLCSELLKDTRVIAGLKGIVWRVEEEFMRDSMFHECRWRYRSCPPCDCCMRFQHLVSMFARCDDAGPIEECLARVSTACLQEFDRRSLPFSRAKDDPSVHPTALRLIFGINLSAYLYRVRIHLLQRAENMSPPSPAALKPPPTGAKSGVSK